MNNSQTFNDFLSNLVIQNRDQISDRYKRITKNLNQKYYRNDSDISNSLKIGSFGRKTAINGISDLDMLFILPPSVYTQYNNYQGNGQSALLQEVKNSIKATYSDTDIRGDGQVVVVNFNNHVIEVCPVFSQSDDSFLYPDANNGGSWRRIDPKPEIKGINEFDATCKGNLKNLAKMTRAWKNKCGVKIGGLLIDTLCYEYLKANAKHQDDTLSNYDILLRDFFEYLKNYKTDRKYWLALGSNQKVYKKGSNFISKAKTAYNNIIEAISKKENNTVYVIWRKVFGLPFPYPQVIMKASLNYTAREEYIENYYPVDIMNKVRIECEVTQAGFRVEFLRKMLGKLKLNKKLRFFVESTDVKEPYSVKWKIKNEGLVAKERDNLRGQILDDGGHKERKEESHFEGAHYVECYIIKNYICVARDRIDVPISNFGG